MAKIKSKKFVVYFYTGEEGGGAINFTNEDGKIIDKQLNFANKTQAKEWFDELADKYCKNP